jgi:HK97 family phage major capsid protein
MDIAALKAERDSLMETLGNDELEGDELDKAVTRANELVGELKDYEAKRGRIADARAAIAAAPAIEPLAGQAAADVADRMLPRGHMTSRQAAKYIAQSREFRRFVANGSHGDASVALDEEATRALFGRVFGTRTLLGGDTDLADDLVIPTPLPGIAESLRRPLRVADLFDRQTTTAGSLSYVRDTSTAPEGVPSTVSPGGQKPESEYTFEIVNNPFAKIAHILPVVQEAVEDVSQLAGYLSGQMVYGIEYKLDSELLNGDGSNGRIDGVIDLGTSDTDPNNEQIVLSIRHAKTLAQQANVNEANLAVVLNPADWDAVETAVASDSGIFLSGTAAFAGVGPRIWGMPVVVTNAITQGTGIVGDFGSSTLWERQTATVSVSDSNQNYFELNILTLRAELRAALQVPQPARFTVVSFDPPSA